MNRRDTKMKRSNTPGQAGYRTFPGARAGVLRNAVALAVTALALTVAMTPAAIAQVDDYRDIKYPALKPFTIPQPERYVMGNGIVVLLMEDHELPLIEMYARVRTGARLEPADKTGLASITGDVMRTGGAGDRTGDQIDDFLDARGARIETSIGIDSGNGVMSSHRDDFADVMAVFADILRTPRFEEEKIGVTKGQEKAGIARRNDDPMGIMFREGSKLVYGADSPYARTTEYATIGSITRDDLVSFHSKYFVPNRVILGVVGDFDPKTIRVQLEKAFGGWKRGPEVKDAEANWRKQANPGWFKIVKNDMTQSDIMMAHIGIRRDNPDYFASVVMNEVLSGSFASRLFNNIRTKQGLAYAVTGSLGANYDYPGQFTAWMTTKSGTTAQAIDSLLAEVKGMIERPATEDEVRLAKDAILNSFIFNSDTNDEILLQQITYAYFGYPSDFLSRFRENVEKVTPADVARAAKTYLKPDNLSILVVGPAEGWDRPLESFGKVTTIDITIPEPGAAEVSAKPAGMSDKEAAARGKMVLDGAIASMGGAGAIDATMSIQSVGTMTMQTPAGEMQIGGSKTVVFPDRVRQKLSTPMGEMLMVIDGSAGFMSTPMGVQDLPSSQMAELKKDMMRDPVALLKNRGSSGFSVMYQGRETVETVDADLIAVTLDGQTVQYAVDPENGHIIRSAYQGRSPSGEPGTMMTFFSDWRKSGGLMLPYKSSLVFEGEPAGSLVVESIDINGPVDDTEFARPEPAGGATGG